MGFPFCQAADPLLGDVLKDPSRPWKNLDLPFPPPHGPGRMPKKNIKITGWVLGNSKKKIQKSKCGKLVVFFREKNVNLHYFKTHCWISKNHSSGCSSSIFVGPKSWRYTSPRPQSSNFQVRAGCWFRGGYSKPQSGIFGTWPKFHFGERFSDSRSTSCHRCTLVLVG